MKLYSWNVNGFQAVVKKGFWDWFLRSDADVVCLQETKTKPDGLDLSNLEENGYGHIWNPAQIKKGYSGVAVFYRLPIVSSGFGLPEKHLRGEGRLIQMELESFYLFNAYFPNGQKGPERLDYKLQFHEAFLQYIQELRRSKPIVFCGDFNIAHQEIDLAHPEAHAKHSGFLPIEREWMNRLVEYGYIDAFRMFQKDPGHYTWWDYKFKAREKNEGWRIDYFFFSGELEKKVKNAWIEPEVTGSDHCPVGLELEGVN